MEMSHIRTMSNFPILVKMPLIFPIPWAPAPFLKKGCESPDTQKMLVPPSEFSPSSNSSQSTLPKGRRLSALGRTTHPFLDFTLNYERTSGIFVP